MTATKSPLAVGVTSRNAAFITELQARNTVLVEEIRRLKAALAAAPASPFEAANSRVAEYHQLKEAYAALEVERDALQSAYDKQWDRADKSHKAWLESEGVVLILERELREGKEERKALADSLDLCRGALAELLSYPQDPVLDIRPLCMWREARKLARSILAGRAPTSAENAANLQNFANFGFAAAPALPDGVPCSHPGCLSHVSHPCEGCGRIAGHAPDLFPDIPGLPFLLDEYRKALAKHPTYPDHLEGMAVTVAEELLEVVQAGMRAMRAVNDLRDKVCGPDDVRREFAHVWVVAGRAVGRLSA